MTNKWVIQITKPGDLFDGHFWSNNNEGPHEFLSDPRVLRFKKRGAAEDHCRGFLGSKVRVVNEDDLWPKYEDQTGHVSRPLRCYTSAERKEIPLHTLVAEYFPDALVAVARHSKKANTKHNGEAPMFWARNKSTDHLNCAVRHLATPDAIDTDTGEIELVGAAWRCLAALQLREEKRLVEAGIKPLSGVTP